jgi:phage-related protein
MGGLIESVGNGITGLVAGAFDAIGGALRGMVNAANQALPGGILFLVAFVVLVAGAWALAKR